MASGFGTDDMEEDLQCPVCFKIPRTTPIYQCKEGHIHCKECHPRLQVCPICRSNVLDMRAITIEKIISKLPLKCVNEYVGCTEEKLTLEEAKRHEKECPFRPMKCSIIDCGTSIPVCQAYNHFKDRHQNYMELDRTNSREFRVNFNENDTTFDPTYLFSMDEHFLCESDLDEDGYFSLTVMLLGDPHKREWFSCQVVASIIVDEDEHGNEIDKCFLEPSSKGFINVVGDEDMIPIMTLNPKQINHMKCKNGFISFEVTVTSDQDVLRQELEVIDATSTQFINDCYDRDVEAVRAKLNGPYARLKSFDINARTKRGLTAFIIACSKGYTDIVHLLVLYGKRMGIDLNATSDATWSGLCYAADQGHLDIVRLLSEKEVQVNFNIQDSRGQSPFMLACLGGHFDVANLFIEKKEIKRIDFSQVDEDGDTAFHFACRDKTRSEELLKLFINSSDKLGIDVDQTNNYGETGFDLLPRALRESLRSKRRRIE